MGPCKGCDWKEEIIYPGLHTDGWWLLGLLKRVAGTGVVSQAVADELHLGMKTFIPITRHIGRRFADAYQARVGGGGILVCDWQLTKYLSPEFALWNRGRN